MTDHLAVESAYRSRLEKVLDLKVPPEGEVPFMLVFYEHPEKMEEMRIRVLPKESGDPLRGLPPAPESTEEEEEPAEKKEDRQTAPSGVKPPASSAGVVVKQKGTIVRMKPKKKKEKPREDQMEWEMDEVPIEVVEEGENAEDVEDAP